MDHQQVAVIGFHRDDLQRRASSIFAKEDQPIRLGRRIR